MSLDEIKEKFKRADPMIRPFLNLIFKKFIEDEPIFDEKETNDFVDKMNKDVFDEKNKTRNT